MAEFEIPGYELYERLGKGGMASVYRALHLNLDREVAIKVMDPRMNSDESFSERFIREARISARLVHPQILQIYDVNTVDGINYIAMEYLGAGDLADIIYGALPQRTVYAVMRQMTEALDYAAKRGYVHRDIKPSNILMRGENDFVLADFGIARAANSGTQMTQTGLMVGTPSYMSPEQAKGQEVDGRSDLYGLAVLWYEMMTKSLPYDSESAVTTAVKHLTEAIPTLPAHLAVYQEFLDRGLAKAPDERFQSGQDMYAALMAASAGFPDEAVLTPGREPPARTAIHSATTAGESQRTSLSGADATRLTGPDRPVPARPYKLESTDKRERLVSGLHERRPASGTGSRLPLALAVVAALAAGAYYVWQQQAGSSGAALRSVASELAAGYSAMNDENFDAAVKSFRAVLAEDAGNSSARQGMEEVATLFASSIEARLQDGRITEARQLATNFGLYFPGDSRQQKLQERVALAGEEKKLARAQAERVGVLLDEAEQQVANKAFTAARATLERAAALDPGSSGVATALRALTTAEAEDEAYRARWQAYTEPQREAFTELLVDATNALAEDRVDEAAARLDTAAAIAPQMPELLAQRKALEARRAQLQRIAAERDAQIAALLASAAAALADAGSDAAQAEQAVDGYREVLTLDDNNADAMAGLKAVGESLQKQAQRAIEAGDFAQAKAVLATGGKLLPEAAGLADLRTQLPALEAAWTAEQTAKQAAADAAKVAKAAEQEAASQREADVAAALQKASDEAGRGMAALARGDLGTARNVYDGLAVDSPSLAETAQLRRELQAAYVRAAGEQIAAADLDAARRLVSAGQSLAPDAPDWDRLAQQIESSGSPPTHRRLGAF